ncbi:MAG: hypothetical protein AAF705_04295 [Bacteroidota bacterium]
MERALFILTFLFGLISCTEKTCPCEGILLPDIYHLEKTGQSRYACMNLPVADHVEQQFTHTFQGRKIRIQQEELSFLFYHQLIRLDLPKSNAPDTLYRIVDLEFGKILLGISFGNNLSQQEAEAFLTDVTVFEANDPSPCFGDSEIKRIEDTSLLNIGAFEWVHYNHRKELRVRNNSTDIEDIYIFLYKNQKILMPLLEPDDILSIFGKKEGKETVLSRFMIIKSIPFLRAEDDWCGVGPMEFGIESFYLSKHYDFTPSPDLY